MGCLLAGYNLEAGIHFDTYEDHLLYFRDRRDPSRAHSLLPKLLEFLIPGLAHVS